MEKSLQGFVFYNLIINIKEDLWAIKSLAAYMSAHGYSWSQAKNNYEKNKTAKQESEPVVAQPAERTPEDEEGWEAYFPILQLLKQNEAKLPDLLQPYGKGGEIPRYAIPSVGKTKTVQMIHSLDQMTMDFSKEKNMSRRDIFEVALINFFKAYGYERQVEVLLNQ